MIPYWVVVYEHKEASAVAMYESYAEAKREADFWLKAVGLPKKFRHPRRATIEGPFYRQGF